MNGYTDKLNLTCSLTADFFNQLNNVFSLKNVRTFLLVQNHYHLLNIQTLAEVMNLL